MSQIEVLVFFHLLGAFLIAGGAGVSMAAGIAMPRSDSVRVIRLLSVMAERGALIATLPGSVLTLATGIWLIADYSFFELEEFWLWSSFVLWAAAAALDHGILGPYHRRIQHAAVQLESEGVETSAELRAAASARRGPLTGTALTAITVVFLYLMVFRPGA